MKRILLLLILLFIVPSIYANTYPEELIYSSSFNEEKDRSPEIKIYPNPCKNNKITIQLESAEIVEVKISNILGKIMQKNKPEVPVNKHQILLNNLPEGIYLVHIKTSDKKTVVKKLLVTK